MHIVGAHAPNSGFTEADWATLRTGAYGGLKLLWYHSPDDVHACRATLGPDVRLLVRLPDSSGDYIPSPADYAAHCGAVVDTFHAVGVREFILDNEPQYQPAWGAATPTGKAEDAFWEWRHFMLEVLPLLRASVCSCVRLGMTPFSHPRWDDWLDVTQDVAVQCDFLCAHSYWQAEYDRWNPMFGANAEALHEWVKELPVWVTEYGTSISQAVPPPADVPAIMQSEYPDWLAWAAARPWITGSCVFLIGGTPDWAGFQVTQETAAIVFAPLGGRL